MDIQAEIERIINSGSLDLEELDDLMMLSNSWQRLYNFYRYISKRDFGKKMNPKKYWQYLGEAYIGNDNNRKGIGITKTLFIADYPYREYLMSKEERYFLDSLPDRITIYRGLTLREVKEAEIDPSKYGISWTLSEEIAQFFAYEYTRNIDTKDLHKTVINKVVQKSDVIAYFSGRKEEEIIYIAS